MHPVFTDFGHLRVVAGLQIADAAFANTIFVEFRVVFEPLADRQVHGEIMLYCLTKTDRIPLFLEAARRDVLIHNDLDHFLAYCCHRVRNLVCGH